MTDREDRKGDGLRRPSLPEVTRLNRNVLLVAAMGVVVVVLAVTHVARSDSGDRAREPVSARVEPGAAGSFLSDTSRAGDVPVPPPAYAELDDAMDTTAAQHPDLAGDGATYAQMGPQQDPFAHGFAAAPDPREEAYERALRAGLRARDDRESRARNVLARMDVPATPGDASLPSDRHQAFMSAASESVEPATYERVRLTEPVSEYQIMAGTVIPAMMVTAMNSDMPGEVLAQVARNVYDSQQRHLLIPRGTRIIGRYDNQVAIGQSRVLLVWTRLIFPDGWSIALPGLPTKDLRGASGLRSRVNNHTMRLYGQAVLLSIIGAGAQLSQPQQSNVLAPSSAGQVAAGALGQELSRVSMETIRRNMDVRPTLEVPAGAPFNIFLGRDLVLDGPYVDQRQDELLAGGESRP